MRTLIFVAMVAGNIALVFSNRSLNTSWQNAWAQPNPVLWWIMLGGSAPHALWRRHSVRNQHTLTVQQ